jgi:hypothetical protein
MYTKKLEEIFELNRTPGQTISDVTPSEVARHYIILDSDKKTFIIDQKMVQLFNMSDDTKVNDLLSRAFDFLGKSVGGKVTSMVLRDANYTEKLERQIPDYVFAAFPNVTGIDVKHDFDETLVPEDKRGMLNKEQAIPRPSSSAVLGGMTGC